MHPSSLFGMCRAMFRGFNVSLRRNPYHRRIDWYEHSTSAKMGLTDSKTRQPMEESVSGESRERCENEKCQDQSLFLGAF
jgi:hypothetical protein